MSYATLRIFEVWLAGYAALFQLLCCIATWRRIALSEIYRYLGAFVFLFAFTYGTLQVISTGAPAGDRVYFLTGALVLIDAGLTATFIKAVRKR